MLQIRNKTVWFLPGVSLSLKPHFRFTIGIFLLPFCGRFQKEPVSLVGKKFWCPSFLRSENPPVLKIYVRGRSMMAVNTLLRTNISHQQSLLKMIFLFPRWDMLVPWRVTIVHVGF